MTLRFASAQNFLDPVLTSDGKPYGPDRYRTLTQERYIISKNANISYEDTGAMTPTERRMILQFMVEDSKRQKEAWENAQKQRKHHKK